MKHRPWRELFERLPAKTQAEVKANTARVLAELDPAEREQQGESRREHQQAPVRPVALDR